MGKLSLCVKMAITRECGGNIYYEGSYGSPKAANVIIAFITTLLPWPAVRRDILKTLYKFNWERANVLKICIGTAKLTYKLENYD